MNDRKFTNLLLNGVVEYQYVGIHDKGYVVAFRLERMRMLPMSKVAKRLVIQYRLRDRRHENKRKYLWRDPTDL